MHGNKWVKLNSLILEFLTFFLLCACVSKEKDDLIMISCEGSLCVIQQNNADLMIELDDKYASKSDFDKSIIHVQYRDEKMKKIDYLIIDNGNISTYISFDDSVGMVQVVGSRKINHDFFFSVFNESGKYRMKKMESIFRNEDD